MISPVILFVYNRPEHTKRTIQSLKSNSLANETDLFIFSDAPKNQRDVDKVKEVRKVINSIRGFKNIHIIEQRENKGLAKSVIDGVSEVIDRYERVIVLEDDLVSSPIFLNYMNECLEKYASDENIWSISGYGPKINIEKDYKSCVYLAPRGCSWGWATWKNRWESIDWEIKEYYNFKKNRIQKKEFNMGGNDLVYMLEDQMNNRIDSWAIRWVYNQFIQKKHTVYPLYSYIYNIGMDFSGTHSSRSDKYKVTLNEKICDININEDDYLNKDIIKSFGSFYNLSLIGLIGVYSRKIGIYKYLRKIQKKIKVKNK
ncbi:glycosyltransferase [Niallia sp. HCP3S3_B10]|uniref:glycosyltransferase n=1 Tax=Niallia sp. HCP3S3_B10 TaxID=3438944 RepID=UPI003F887319